MKKKQILFFACCLALGGSTTDLCAQRTMDKLGRGLVATVTQSGSGNFVSWRVLGEEYYDVTYNLYADGVLVAKGLSASNYVHTEGIQFLFPYRTEYRFPQSAGCGNERT